MTTASPAAPTTAETIVKVLLGRNQVLEATDMKFEDVPTPEWAPKGTDPAAVFVRIRNLTAEGRAVFIQRSVEAEEAKKAAAAAVAAGTTPAPKGKFDVEILLVAMTAINEGGTLLFSEADVAVLGLRNAAPVARCAKAAQLLSGLDAASQEKAVKN